jgi:5-methylcytosine-specific restriction endonuclease McrA
MVSPLPDHSFGGSESVVSKAWAKGSTRQWRKVRALVLARDAYRCQVRIEGCTGQASHVHHVHGRGVTGDDPRFLVASCQHCNLKIGDPTKLREPEPKRVTGW